MIPYLLLDPNGAYLILVLAFVVTILAMLAPGTGILEIAALLLLGFVGFGIAYNPVNTWAIILILAGTVLVFIAMRRTTRWYFLALAIAVLVVGTAFLYKAPFGLFAAEALLVLVASISMGVFIWIIAHFSRSALIQTASNDPALLIGMTGKAITDIHTSGSVRVKSEEWSAVSAKPIMAGSSIAVLERNGLVLTVKKADAPEK